jgi:hypothetical protein
MRQRKPSPLPEPLVRRSADGTIDLSRLATAPFGAVRNWVQDALLGTAMVRSPDSPEPQWTALLDTWNEASVNLRQMLEDCLVAIAKKISAEPSSGLATPLLEIQFRLQSPALASVLAAWRRRLEERGEPVNKMLEIVDADGRQPTPTGSGIKFGFGRGEPVGYLPNGAGSN